MAEENRANNETRRQERPNNNNNRDNNNRGGDRPQRQRRVQIPRFIFKKKKCRLCKMGIKEPDYKDIELLSRFVSDRGKIIPRRMSGSCAKHQRKIKTAVKRARYMALLPFLKAEKISK